VHLDRRTFLRGMGATVALPLLDAMIPARALLASTRGVPRLAFVYVPHGVIMDEWTPPAGPLGGIGLPRVLEPLTPFRDRLTVVSGLENRHAYGPVHAITPGTWLSGTSPPRATASGSRPPAAHVARGCAAAGGLTADQMAAEHLGQRTPIASLHVAAEEPRTIGAGIWEGQYDPSYGTTISFRRGSVPVPMVCRPRAVFDGLFRHDATPGAGDPRAPESGSVLDRVADATARLRMRLGPADRVVLDDYLASVRDVERRVDRADREPCADEDAQAEIAQRFTGRLALMFDLIALAFRADLTRVASMMMAAETSAMTYDHVGVPEPFHRLSHHQHDPDRIEQLVRIQAFHTRAFAAFVRTLAETRDGDGSLLDRSLILFGSNMRDSHAHDHGPLPLAVVGGGCGTLRGGRHLQCADHTPMSNLLVAMLQRSGVPVQAIGDSTDDGVDLR
jgi:hypothetical protein